MNFAVVDAATSESGSLSVLNDFCNYLAYMNDNENHWYIFTSVVEIKETNNIHNIRVPKVKQSRFARLHWEKYEFSIYAEKLGIDIVFSLQNNAMPKGQYKQIVYVHIILLAQKYKKFLTSKHLI